mmetsp:Transcript_24535/g.69972  ORF Transcript_24535/g.69972 Transcript_24535/m.69972 type:complete len:446 (-) Transcript_24535:323-1660(-)
MATVALLFYALVGRTHGVRRHSAAGKLPAAHGTALLEGASSSDFPIALALTGGLLTPHGHQKPGRHVAPLKARPAQFGVVVPPTEPIFLPISVGIAREADAAVQDALYGEKPQDEDEWDEDVWVDPRTTIPAFWPETWREWMMGGVQPIPSNDRHMRKYRAGLWRTRTGTVYQIAPRSKSEWAYWRNEVDVVKRFRSPHFPLVLADTEVEEQDGQRSVLLCRDNGANYFGTLGDLIAQDDGAHTLPMDSKVKLMLDVLSAVGHLAELGYAHSHISPESVLVSGNCSQPQTCRGMLDVFGYAVKLNRDAHVVSPRQNEVEAPRQYISPELAIDGSLGARHDVWSLGIMFYELLLSGILPLGMYRTFDTDEDFLAYVGNHLDIAKDHDFLEFSQEHAALASVLEHMLERDPEERWSASQASKELEHVARTFPRLEALLKPESENDKS